MAQNYVQTRQNRRSFARQVRGGATYILAIVFAIASLTVLQAKAQTFTELFSFPNPSYRWRESTWWVGT